MTVKGVLKGIWEFCSYVFWPQWGQSTLTKTLTRDEDNRHGFVG